MWSQRLLRFCVAFRQWIGKTEPLASVIKFIEVSEYVSKQDYHTDGFYGFLSVSMSPPLCLSKSMRIVFIFTNSGTMT